MNIFKKAREIVELEKNKNTIPLSETISEESELQEVAPVTSEIEQPQELDFEENRKALILEKRRINMRKAIDARMAKREALKQNQIPQQSHRDIETSSPILPSSEGNSSNGEEEIRKLQDELIKQKLIAELNELKRNNELSQSTIHPQNTSATNNSFRPSAHLQEEVAEVSIKKSFFTIEKIIILSLAGAGISVIFLLLFYGGVI